MKSPAKSLKKDTMSSFSKSETWSLSRSMSLVDGVETVASKRPVFASTSIPRDLEGRTVTSIWADGSAGKQSTGWSPPPTSIYVEFSEKRTRQTKLQN